jgi:hypothetical protein
MADRIKTYSTPMPTPLTRWRSKRLRAAGFSPSLADELAAEDRIDLHELLELIDHGCPPHLAARIVAPLEDRA